MKTTLLALIAFAALGASSLSGLTSGIQANDELPSVDLKSPIAAIQEPAPTTQPSAQEQQSRSSEASPSDMPVEPETVVEWDSAPVVYPEGATFPEGAMCATCRPQVCCCEVATTLCLVDPCDGCSYEACVHLPHCCVGVAPVVEWKNGILGRKIISLCWPCCDKRAKVVVPVIGDVRVWE